MTSIKQEANILKYRKQKHLNIGIVIFGIIFIYLIATIIMYLIAPRVSVYEVRQGSILKDNAYTGLALREETVVYTDEDGYVNYYIDNNSKVRANANMYTISNQKLEFKEAISEEDITLTQEEKRSLLLKIQSYNEQYKENDFSSTYQLKNELQHVLNGIAHQSKSEQLQALIANGEFEGLTMKSATRDGIVVYAVDGLETLTIDNITSDKLQKVDYKQTKFTNNMQVKSGDPIYKLVTNDRWNLLLEVSEDTKVALSQKQTVSVRIKKDNQKLIAQLAFLENTEKPTICLSFDNSMIRYVNERYLDIELILEDESGLKIPKTAETTKNFYVVPQTYLTQGGNSSSDGVMRQTKDAEGNSITEFLSVTVYYEADDMIYLDPNVFDKGDILVKPDSAETYPLNETRSLNGVYCINKGYAVFKQIHILCESDEYYIIEEGNDFGLSNYDHIALDSQSIKENDVIF